MNAVYCMSNVWAGGCVMYEDSDIKRVAVEMVAEFGENAEQELRERYVHAKAQGLTVTASVWERVLLSVEKLRQDNDRSGNLK